MTNLWQYYSVPVVVPPVQCDDPTQGVPSDHSTPIAYPLSGSHQIKNDYKDITIQTLPDSGVREFGRWITAEDWSSVPDNVSPTEQVEKFNELVAVKMNAIFPKKNIRITQKDKPWINLELKKLDRSKKRE